eukprot:6116538-Pleurochrysis_carterae.AAC.1
MTPRTRALYHFGNTPNRRLADVNQQINQEQLTDDDAVNSLRQLSGRWEPDPPPSLGAPCVPSAARTFLPLLRARSLALSLSRSRSLALSLSLSRALARTLARSLARSRSLARTLARARSPARGRRADGRGAGV